MTYNPNVPFNPSSSIGQGQIDFQKNFQALYSAFVVNHVALDAVSGAGNHTVLQFPEQEQAFQTDTGELAVYSKNVSGQTDQLFLRYQFNGTEFQYSNYQIYPLEATSAHTPFFTFLPGKVIAYFGILNVTLEAFSTFELILRPAICKHIITMNFCPVGLSASYPPYVSLQSPSGEQGVYSVINLMGNPKITNPTQLYYLILGTTA